MARPEFEYIAERKGVLLRFLNENTKEAVSYAVAVGTPIPHVGDTFQEVRDETEGPLCEVVQRMFQLVDGRTVVNVKIRPIESA